MPRSLGDAPLPLEIRPAAASTLHEIPVVGPYRLDLTVSVWRRLSTNVVNVFTPEATTSPCFPYLTSGGLVSVSLSRANAVGRA